jgi:hypothetical protein
MKKFILILLFLIFTVIISSKTSFAKDSNKYAVTPFTYAGFSNSGKIYNFLGVYNMNMGIFLGRKFVKKYNGQIGFGYYILKHNKNNKCDILINMMHLTSENMLDANIAYSIYTPNVKCTPNEINYRLKRDADIILSIKNKIIKLFNHLAKKDSGK